MFWLFKKYKPLKNPKEILMDKYMDLINTNGIDWEITYWDRYPHFKHKYIKWFIVWTNIQVFWKYDQKFNYSYDKEPMCVNFICWNIWIITDNDFVQKTCDKLLLQIKEKEERIEKDKKEIEEKKKIEEEEMKKVEEDEKYMNEFKRISWIWNEFKEKFKILDEIKSIWDRQKEILSEWNDNVNKIYEKREVFYSKND